MANAYGISSDIGALIDPNDPRVAVQVPAMVCCMVVFVCLLVLFCLFVCMFVCLFVCLFVCCCCCNLENDSRLHRQLRCIFNVLIDSPSLFAL